MRRDVILVVLAAAWTFAGALTISVNGQQPADQARPGGPVAPPAASTSNPTSPLAGTWVFIAMAGGQTNPLAPGNRIKVFTESTWQVTQILPGSGVVQFHHGGTYTLVGDDYTEKVEYANESTANLINQVGRMKVVVTGDTMVQIGSNNSVETWRRVPLGMKPADVAARAGGSAPAQVQAGVTVPPAAGRAAATPVSSAVPARGTGPMPLASQHAVEASDNPQFRKAVEDAEAAMRASKYDEALDAFKRANGLQGKRSAAALYGVSRAYASLLAFKSEAEACAEGLKYVGDDKYPGRAAPQSARDRAGGALHEERGQGAQGSRGGLSCRG